MTRVLPQTLRLVKIFKLLSAHQIQSVPVNQVFVISFIINLLFSKQRASFTPMGFATVHRATKRCIWCSYCKWQSIFKKQDYLWYMQHLFNINLDEKKSNYCGRNNSRLPWQWHKQPHHYYILYRHKMSFQFISFSFSLSFECFSGKLFLDYLVICRSDQKELVVWHNGYRKMAPQWTICWNYVNIRRLPWKRKTSVIMW